MEKRSPVLFVVLLSLTATAGCGVWDGLFGGRQASLVDGGATCMRSPLEVIVSRAGSACSAANPCPGGSFCNMNGVCDWNCYGDDQCATGQVCSCDGVCIGA